MMNQLVLYKNLIFAYNKKTNIISRKITEPELDMLIEESLFLLKLMSCETIIDAGSGNGLLGFPIAFADFNKEIWLVESNKKKIVFLQNVKESLKIGNVYVYGGSIQEFIRGFNKRTCSIISRGFPRIEILSRFVEQRKAMELLVITSKNTIKKLENHIEKIAQNVYNIPWRTDLIVLKQTYVSRETL